jgi:hypothetical protein
VIDSEVPAEALAALGAALGTSLRPGRALRAGRSTVQRATLPDGSSTVLKVFGDRGAEWAREVAALESLPAGLIVPRLLAATDQPPALAMTDLGAGGSVADALLGTDPLAAESAVLAWAEAIATLHSATGGDQDAFRRALAERDPTARAEAMPELLDTAAADLVRLGDALGVTAPSDAPDRLRALLPARQAPALTPSDASPDNNTRTDSGLALLDFEGAQIRHVAWDVAYLQVPWPSCWCSWRMPDRVGAAALARYRAVCSMPYVRGVAFQRDLRRAVVGWALVSTSWFSANALGADPDPLDERIVAPTRRAMILHRLGEAARERALEPGLARWAGRLRRAFVDRWGEVPLDHAPAFRPTAHG